MYARNKMFAKGFAKSFVAMLLTAIGAFAVVMPVAAEEKPPGGGIAPECAASVTITGLSQVNLSVRVDFAWTTIGASAANARVEMFHHSSGTQVYNSGLFPVSPLPGGSMQHMIPPPGGTPFPAGTYRVRVRLSANCGAGSQYERFIAYTGTPVLVPIVRCDSASAANNALMGEQCLSFVPNGSGGYTLNDYANTNGDPQSQGAQHPFLGVGCRTLRNGVQIENYEVENPLGSIQGNFVEFGATNGAFWQTGASSSGFNLPTAVPNVSGTVYSRACYHWAGWSDVSTSVSVTLP